VHGVDLTNGDGGLVASDVAKSYGAVQALTNASLQIKPGEIASLVGDNGAGKSTFVKILSGVLTPDTGSLTIDGEPVEFFGSSREAHAAGVVTVYQDLALIETLPVVENVFLGQELTRGPFRRKAAMRDEAAKLLGEMAVGIPDPTVRVERLSGGQRQGVAFARALYGRAKYFLLDEPTAATGLRETREIVRLIETLRDRGAGVLMICHDFPLVVELSDKIFVLRHGAIAQTFDRGVELDDVVLAMARG
jgi:ABC-type sugar transport system ATPase subunit